MDQNVRFDIARVFEKRTFVFSFQMGECTFQNRPLWTWVLELDMAKRSFLQLQEVIDLKRPKVGNVEPDDDFHAKMCVFSAIAAVIGSFLS